MTVDKELGFWFADKISGKLGKTQTPNPRSKGSLSTIIPCILGTAGLLADQKVDNRSLGSGY